MRRPRPEGPDDLAGPFSGPGELATDALYAQHGDYVLALLPSYGVAAQDVEEVAQTVWLHVHRRRDSYDATKHKTPRAWITGFAQRCAANHRRAQRRRPLTLLDDLGDLRPAPGLSAEQAAILENLHELIPDDDQRTALLLRVRHGLSIEEIAAVQGVSESAMRRRLHMARKALKTDDDKKSRAYLGFGSLEALAEALRPPPIPPEVRDRVRQRVAERIRQEETPPPDTDPPPPSDSLAPAQPAPPSPLPPAPALPPLTSTAAPTLLALGKAKLAALLILAFVSGAGAGVAALLAWLAHDAARHARIPSTMPPAPAPRTAPSTPSSASALVNATTSPSTAPTASSAPPPPSAAPSTSTLPPASSAPPGPTDAGSQRILARMRQAIQSRHFSEVLRLAAQHAHQFSAENAPQREALRVEALREMGHTHEAAEHARAVITAYPQHRRKIERAAGHALP